MTDTTTEARQLRPLGWVGPSGAQVTAHISVWAPLDNWTPARREAALTLEQYTWPQRDDGFIGVELSIPGGLDHFRHGANALWLLDDSDSVSMYHTATFHPTERNIGLKSFPAGLIGGFGPRITYHLMITGRTDHKEP